MPKKYKGTDWVLTLDFSSNASIDLTGWKIYFSLKKSLLDEDADADGYLLTHNVTAGEIASKVVVLTVPAAVNALLPNGNYYRGIKIIGTASKVSQVGDPVIYTVVDSIPKATT